ncbi:MAG: TadE/TadG family type IV pilus assembly protein [Alphaproteobacteria bacterium]
MARFDKLRAVFGRFADDRRGSTALEFALTSVALFAMIVGIVEFGRVLETRNKLEYAVDHGTRLILMNPTISMSQVEQTIRDSFDHQAAETLHFVFATETVDGIDYRTFNITYPMSIRVPFIDNSITLSITRRTPAI